MTATDAELLALARDDPGAFREVYDRYAERVHGYATAETFARVWLGRTRVRDDAGGSAAPWMSTRSPNPSARRCAFASFTTFPTTASPPGWAHPSPPRACASTSASAHCAHG